MTETQEAARAFPQPMPDFKRSEERDRWITEHAEYFTVIRVDRKRSERHSTPTLAQAEALASERLKENPEGRFLIYAVYSIHDCFVKSVMKKEDKAVRGGL